MTHRDTTCLLCGLVSHDVSVALVEWKQPVDGRFAAIPRCRDHLACRGRVEGNGDAWEVSETTVSARELIEGRR